MPPRRQRRPAVDGLLETRAQHGEDRRLFGLQSRQFVAQFALALGFDLQYEASLDAGIGFAIPVDIINRVVPQFIRDGLVPTPGIGIVAVSEQDATRLGVEGIPILRTIPESSAARAGLRGVDMRAGTLGDIIVSANDKPVRRLSDLTTELDEIGVGRDVKLRIKRSDRTETINIAIADVGQGRLGMATGQ